MVTEAYVYHGLTPNDDEQYSAEVFYSVLCVLTGDYRFDVYGPCHNVSYHMEKILAQVHARDGIVGILGNHGFMEEVSALELMGVKMLVNEGLVVHRGPAVLWLIGLDDPHDYGCDDLPGALHGVPLRDSRILLVHTPEMIEDAEASGIQLYVCGNTHRGQICLGGLGPLLVNANCPRPYTRGIWQYGWMRGDTSAGVGASLLPVRFFCPPEIGLIELCCTRHR